MTAPIDLTPFEARVQYILKETLDAMPAEEKAKRIAWCQHTGRHGITMSFTDDDMLLFTWAGEPLALVPRAAFDDESDAYLRPLLFTPVEVTPAPDDARDLLRDNDGEADL